MKFASVFLIIIFPGYLFSQNPDLSGTSFAVDPGHGGNQSGAVSPFGAQEKWINLKVSRFLRDFFLAAGADKVVMTRNSDIRVELGDREAVANSNMVDWFHSVHHNAPGSPNDHTTDFSMVLYEETGSGPAFPGRTDVIADTMSLMLSKAFNITNFGGIGDSTFYGQASFLDVLNDLNMPGQLSEAFFMSAYNEEQKMRNDDYLKTEAEAIYLSFLIQLDKEMPATGTLVGIVKDITTGFGGINITVTDLRDSRSTVVDTIGNGFFRLDSMSPGSHSIEFTSELETIQIERNVTAGRINRTSVGMNTNTNPLFISPSIPRIRSVTLDADDISIN